MKTGLIFIVLGCLLFIISTVGPFFIIIPLFFLSTGEQFSAPCTKEFKISTKGQYYLWNDYKTSFEDKNYSLPKKLPDTINYELKNESGKVIGVFISDTSQTNTSFGDKTRSVGYYDLSPGKYYLTIHGLEETRIFSFGKNKFTEIGPYIAVGFVAAMLSTPISMIMVLIGIVLLIIGVVQRSKISRLEAESLKH